MVQQRSDLLGRIQAGGSGGLHHNARVFQNLLFGALSQLVVNDVCSPEETQKKYRNKKEIEEDQKFESPHKQVIKKKSMSRISKSKVRATTAHHSTHSYRRAMAVATAAFLAAGCAARKPLPPLPVYPPVPEGAVRQLRYAPSTPYDKLEIVTIEAEAGAHYLSALRDARQSAASKGGNAMILVEDKVFRDRTNGRHEIIRRTIYWVVHLK